MSARGISPGTRARTFDELRLPDDLLLVDVPRWFRLICTVCGRRATSIYPDWRGYRSRGSPDVRVGIEVSASDDAFAITI